MTIAPANTWTDEHGEPLGHWEEVTRDEWWAIVADHGGLEELTVFSTLTDPHGTYGPPTIYTAWGLVHEDAPLLDVREDCEANTTVRHRYVLRESQ